MYRETLSRYNIAVKQPPTPGKLIHYTADSPTSITKFRNFIKFNYLVLAQNIINVSRLDVNFTCAIWAGFKIFIFFINRLGNAQTRALVFINNVPLILILKFVNCTYLHQNYHEAFFSNFVYAA